MKKQLSKFLIGAILLSSLSACQMREDGQFRKQDIGAVSGAVIGGVLGSKVGGGSGKGIAIGVGTLLGAMAGSSIGQSLDQADLAYYNKTSQTALETAPTGRPTTWKNPDSGNYGTVTPTRTFETASGGYCREYSQTITVGGETEKAYGTACRQADGSWKITQQCISLGK